MEYRLEITQPEHTHIAPVSLQQTIAVLERTPAALNSLLRGLPDAWTIANEGEGTWCAFDVLGHLAYAEQEDWMPRARTILEFGESRPFEPFDRLGQARASQGKDLPQLLDLFARLRSENLQNLGAMNLGKRELDLRGRHPQLGTVTLGQLMATWAAHDLTHLHQISRIMAFQLREAVGPWNRFLGVLQCAGHSSAA